jgi:hypothetical protein
MKTFFLFLVFSTAVLAADKKTEQLIHAAMQYNFDACNRENIAEVMDSCADEMPDREKFKRETESTFKEKDIHYSLVECELLAVNLPYAKARIVQDTHVLDRKTNDVDAAEYRNSSALLPGERVEYLNTFKREKGKWKLLLIVSEMKVIKKEKAEAE